MKTRGRDGQKHGIDVVGVVEVGVAVSLRMFASGILKSAPMIFTMTTPAANTAAPPKKDCFFSVAIKISTFSFSLK